MVEGVSRQHHSDLRWKNQQIIQRQMLLSLSLSFSISLFLSLSLSLSLVRRLHSERGDRLVTEPSLSPQRIDCFYC